MPRLSGRTIGTRCAKQRGSEVGFVPAAQPREAFPEAGPYRNVILVILDRDSKFDADVIAFQADEYPIALAK